MHLSCLPIHCQISWKHHLIFLPNLISFNSQLPKISILPVCRNASIKVIIMAYKISYLITYFLLSISLWHLAIGIPPYVLSKKQKQNFRIEVLLLFLLLPPSVLISLSFLLALYSFLADLVHKVSGISSILMIFKSTHLPVCNLSLEL